MKLPLGNKAYIAKDKLIDYLLSETHPVGSYKAKFFRGLGFNEKNIKQLEKSLLKIAKIDVKEERFSKYGTNYVIEGILKGSSGKTAKIITVWFSQTDKDKPSFVTAYPV